MCLCVCLWRRKRGKWGERTYHHGLEDLIADGGQDSLVVVDADFSVDAREGRGLWPVQDTQCDVDVLQICTVVGTEGRGRGTEMSVS